MRVTDWRGNTYGVGSKVVYPRAWGHSLALQEGLVDAVYLMGPDPAGGWDHVRRPDDPDLVVTHEFNSGNRWSPNGRVVVKIAPTRSSRCGNNFKVVSIDIIENITVIE